MQRPANDRHKSIHDHRIIVTYIHEKKLIEYTNDLNLASNPKLRLNHEAQSNFGEVSSEDSTFSKFIHGA